MVLADLSRAMLEEARARLRGGPLAPGLAAADAVRLPFGDEVFDAAVASHVLYHVPDRSAALVELHRVLRPGGRVLVATNGAEHLFELRELLARFGLGGVLYVGRGPEHFDLETAALEVAAVFGDARVHHRRDVLAVTDTAPLVRYVRSLLPAGAAQDGALGRFSEHVERAIARAGSLGVRVAAGAIEAVRR